MVVTKFNKVAGEVYFYNYHNKCAESMLVINTKLGEHFTDLEVAWRRV